MSDSNSKVPILIVIVIAVILIAAGGFFILKPDSSNLDKSKFTSFTSKDTVTLYKNEGAWKVYYDSEFDVYCWTFSGSVGTCKTSAELGLRKR